MRGFGDTKAGASQPGCLQDSLILTQSHGCSLCHVVQVIYTWESLDGWGGIPSGGYSLKNLVLPPPVPAEAGQTYKLRLTARFTGSPAAAAADVTLTAVGTPLSAALLGPSGDIMGDKAIVLDASRSIDPDDPKVCIMVLACVYDFCNLPQACHSCACWCAFCPTCQLQIQAVTGAGWKMESLMYP
jgi:hypothetical protein